MNVGYRWNSFGKLKIAADCPLKEESMLEVVFSTTRLWFSKVWLNYFQYRPARSLLWRKNLRNYYLVWPNRTWEVRNLKASHIINYKETNRVGAVVGKEKDAWHCTLPQPSTKHSIFTQQIQQRWWKHSLAKNSEFQKYYHICNLCRIYINISQMQFLSTEIQYSTNF